MCGDTDDDDGGDGEIGRGSEDEKELSVPACKRTFMRSRGLPIKIPMAPDI